MQIFFELIVSEEFIGAGIRMATPLLLAALGGILSERSGVINIGLEGMMLIGAFTAVLGSQIFGSPWLGLVAAIIAGGLLALLHAFASVTLGADQVVSGVGINLLALGLTGFLNRVIFGVRTQVLRVEGFTPVSIPGLSKIPFIGPTFFQQIPIVYIGFLLVLIIDWLLFHTALGLKLRSVGEYPRAADTVGVNVYLIRYMSVIASGMLAAVGGSVLSLGNVNFFLEDMTQGRGYIAMAALIVGRWNPWGTLAATLLFGLAEALQLRFQAFDVRIVPFHFLIMLPYVLSILALAGFVGRSAAPSASAKPYFKDEA